MSTPQPRARDGATLRIATWNLERPSLRGHTAGYLLQRLQAFRTGQAPDATVMTRLMKGYDDAQVEALAAD